MPKLLSRLAAGELWQKVRHVTGKNSSCLNYVTVEELNQHFATISTDQWHTPPLSKATVNVTSPCGLFSKYCIFRMLEQRTLASLDNLPYWFIQLGAPSLSLANSHKFNLSLQQSTVPTQWKASTITPVPKVEPPQTCSDYRRISITPILARLMEKNNYQGLPLSHPQCTHPDNGHLFQHQFTSRPTGSTTSSLIYLLHTLTELLHTLDYIHVNALYFFNASNSVRHH